jgi:quercetin dioxygenase-like cupin family protein
MSAFGDLGRDDPLRIWDGVVAWTIQGERETLALIELEPGTVVPEHAHENEQVGVLLRGSLTFRIDGEEGELGPGETWAIRPQAPHDVVAGPGGATLVEVFVPRRDDWSALERLPGRRPQPLG